MILRGVKRRNVDCSQLNVQRECMHVIRFQSVYSTIYGYVPRNLCSESAVPEKATRQGKVPGQESNGVFSVTLGALNPSSLRRISLSPSP